MIEGLLFFILGVALTAAIAYAVYKRQSKESSESEARLLQLLEQQMQYSVSTASTMNGILENQREISSEFIHIKDALMRALKQSNGNGFSAVASAVARQSIPSLLRNLPKPTTLSTEWICDAHRKLFPGKPEMAGAFREKEVWVSDFRRGTDKKNALFVPPPPNEVTTRMNTLLHDWNNRISTLQAASLDAKLRAVAEFHNEFVLIHPFMDGNGTLGRLLTCVQMRDLTGKTISLDLQDLKHMPDYYHALEAARNGDIEPLVNNIRILCGLKRDAEQGAEGDAEYRAS